MAFVLEVAQKVGEDLHIGGKAGPVLLKLRASLVVVQATVYPHPGLGSQWYGCRQGGRGLGV